MQAHGIRSKAGQISVQFSPSCQFAAEDFVVTNGAVQTDFIYKHASFLKKVTAANLRLINKTKWSECPVKPFGNDEMRFLIYFFYCYAVAMTVQLLPFMD